MAKLTETVILKIDASEFQTDIARLVRQAVSDELDQREATIRQREIDRQIDRRFTQWARERCARPRR